MAAIPAKYCKWYAVVDDLIGGYLISTIDKPASQLDMKTGCHVASFTSKENADHIAELHNAWLDRNADVVVPFP